MEEKIAELLTTQGNFKKIKNQLSTLNHNYNNNENIPIEASRKHLEHGIKYNSPLENFSERIVIPNVVYVQMLQDSKQYYEARAKKLVEEIHKGFNSWLIHTTSPFIQ